MYRVGFGDCFLVTLPGRNDPEHILIDCGVHSANIDSMDDCVQDLKNETGGRLALVILTHYHADHMSGFASNYDEFAAFEVGAVWITNRLDPSNEGAMRLMAQVTSVAARLQLELGARDDVAAREARNKVINALGLSASGGNAKALSLLQSGFNNKPPVYYYQGGDKPTLPSELEGIITAEILAPAPMDRAAEFAVSDYRAQQYLAAASERGDLPLSALGEPVGRQWRSGAEDYPLSAFDEFDSGDGRDRRGDGATVMQGVLHTMQPDALAAAAEALDGTLNNHSLVVLFTCQGKKLLFVGDAQWGNWAYWLYGDRGTSDDAALSDEARGILGSIDFYKVGHHGSTNATPIPALVALSDNCAAMCSTATGAYGSRQKRTEVPRTALLEQLEQRTGNKLVRSDWVAAGNAKPDARARKAMPKLPPGFSSPGELYIDYAL
jgi:beta-lactamase superfamily II metal-dependent hydrolase